MYYLLSAVGGLCRLTAQTVTLKPGEKVCDQNITLERWLVFGVSVAGLLFCLLVIWRNTAAEISLTNIGKTKLITYRERNVNRATLIEALLERFPQVSSVINLANVICYILAPALAISAVHQFNLYGIEVSLFVLLLVFIVLVLVRAVPRGMAINQPETTAARHSAFIQTETDLLTPLVRLVNGISNGLLRLLKLQPVTANPTSDESEMTMLENMSTEEGLVEGEREMIRSIFEFGDRVVREVMKPRLDISGVPLHATIEQALDVIIGSGKSRLPVYDPDIDHVVGILYAKDLLSTIRQNRPFNLLELVREAYFVPDSKKVDQLFAEMQQGHMHIAIVVDEYGGTAGLVTIEDLLEEIVGDIQDEYDSETADIERLDDGILLVDARVNLEDINDTLDTEWDSESVETAGGFVFDKLGRIPEEGENLLVSRAGLRVELTNGIYQVASEDTLPNAPADPAALLPVYRITVSQVLNRRVQQLRIEVMPTINASTATSADNTVSTPLIAPPNRITGRLGNGS